MNKCQQYVQVAEQVSAELGVGSAIAGKQTANVIVLVHREVASEGGVLHVKLEFEHKELAVTVGEKPVALLHAALNGHERAVEGDNAGGTHPELAQLIEVRRQDNAIV